MWVFGLWQLIMLTVKCYGYKIPPGLFSNIFAVEYDEMSQIGIPIIVLHNKKLKGGIAACYETWFYEYP